MFSPAEINRQGIINFLSAHISLSSNCEVLTTLTPDSGRILSKLHAVQPKGKICFGTGIRVAHVSVDKLYFLQLFCLCLLYTFNILFIWFCIIVQSNLSLSGIRITGGQAPEIYS